MPTTAATTTIAMAESGNQGGMRMWPSESTATLIFNVASLVFVGSLAVGVVATVAVIWMGNVKEEYWESDRRTSKEKIAELDTQAEQLRKDTAEANAQAAKAQLELATFRAPRRIEPMQASNISSQIRRFSGIEFDTASAGNDPEQADFLWLLETALLDAGWKQIDWKGGDIVITRSGRSIAGIVSVANAVLQVHPENVSKLWPAMVALATVLTNEGFVVRAEQGLGVKNDNPTAIHIMVGRKQ